jgi:crotonobetainyl-CoA:carnitine CoA-transferase CaiB-like acyl-CoA transferase
VAPGRLGNRHPSIAPYETVRCRDGYLALAVANDRQWDALVTLTGEATLRDARFATNPGRVENHDDMISALEGALAADDAAGWIARLHEVGVPAGKVNDIAEALALATTLGLDPVVDVGAAHPGQVRHPVRYSGFDPVEPTAPPALDAQGAALREWLSRPPS